MGHVRCSSAQSGQVGRRSGRHRLLGAASLSLAVATVTAGLGIAPAGAEGAATAPVGAPKYTVEDLGTVGFDSYGTAINASGQVAGYARVPLPTGGSAYHAVRWTGTTMTDLGDLGCRAEGRAIADDGTVAGVSNVTCAESDTRGFRSTPDGLHDIGGLLPGTTTRANGINAAGQIVGASQNSSGLQAIVTDPFGLGVRSIDSLLAPRPDFRPNAIEAYGVNTQGDVVGFGVTGPECGGHPGVDPVRRTG